MKLSSNKKVNASYLRDAVYAANDGIITTFAVVAGAYGAGLDHRYVLIFGFASLLADALSMASGVYLGIKSEKQYNGGLLISRLTRNYFDQKDTPISHSYVTFVSFVIAGFSTLIPYILGSSNSFSISFGILVSSMALLGYFRSLFTSKNKLATILETIAVGIAAAIIAYLIGLAAESVV